MSIRERRHRLPRESYRGRVIASFTACIESRRPAFVTDILVRQFVESLRKTAERNRCLVLIYCFMPDHLHLILQGADDHADVWRAMVDFKQQTGFWFGRNQPQVAWQKDFHDHIIRSDEDLGAQIRYIADNPVRRGLVKIWSAYPFTGSIGIELVQVLADTTTL